MPRYARLAAFASLSLVLAGPLPAAEPVPITEETVAKRIDLAGRQRMLTERMAKFFCYARSGVNILSNVDKLSAARTLFTKTHFGFRDGDPNAALFAEESSAVLASWNRVDRSFTDLDAIYRRALGGELVTEDQALFVNELTQLVRSKANDMVAELRAAYAGYLGDGGFGSALLIDMYGRQRMLSQKLSKEVCLVAGGNDLERNLPELNETLNIFEASLEAFRKGAPFAGIPTPPTEEIAAQLEIAHGEWAPIRDTARKVAKGGAASFAELSSFADGADRFLVEMNKAVQMLAALSKSES
ncbi:MAG: type IV pili methyl-accepting chemotaxis transducer N-terminal domain-containing protein [Pseudomonadota bacterium]